MKKVLIAVSVLFGLWSTSMADEGADLFKKCAVCHGVQGEKAALGKSKIIKDMSKEQITAALKGYKDGSYGAASKAVMKGQVASLNDAQITALAAHIGK
ncbi:c-type cytochrome [Sulfuricurvum sp.]|uniref:c-type cytochrome n=1 Tax=Sulfuricurvum sp. TaxID=2025608 RepID=UPI00260938C4|nr:c-type cytochrome [Sulfuricurvum sp.]MDD3598291.1 c-type cytochrome [Sulfuricurvum sp.]